jgi:hypothetical protein
MCQALTQTPEAFWPVIGRSVTSPTRSRGDLKYTTLVVVIDVSDKEIK